MTNTNEEQVAPVTSIEPEPEPELELVPAFNPANGDRITLEYPYHSVNAPTKVVGEVFNVEDDGFYVSSQPLGHVWHVDPKNFAEHGATFRPWKKSDGWPTERTRTVKKKKKKLPTRHI